MGKRVNGHEVIQLFEQFSPKALAEDGDPIGLQIGRLNQPVERVLVALDVTEEVVQEAVDQGAKLIIAHHPLIYRPLKTIPTDQPVGRIISNLLAHDIALYIGHTNLDVAKGGVNDLLADALELTETKVLAKTKEDALKKLAVFVPESHEEAVRTALAEAGAGRSGEYSDCSFTSAGTGRFKPGSEADPYIGKAGAVEEVREVKIETIVPASLLSGAVKAMKKAHPYEEVAYDVLPLDQPGEALGLGRIGKLREPMTLKEFAAHVKRTLDVPTARVVGDPETVIKKVAVLGGTGNRYTTAAKFGGADVFVSGDIDYHVAHDAMMMGLSIVDPGHNIEKIMKKGTAEEMNKRAEAKGFDVSFHPSVLNTEPFSFQ